MAQGGGDLRAWLSAALADNGPNLEARLDALERAAAAEDRHMAALAQRLDALALEHLQQARELAADAEAAGVGCNMAPTWGTWLADVERELLGERHG